VVNIWNSLPNEVGPILLILSSTDSINKLV